MKTKPKTITLTKTDARAILKKGAKLYVEEQKKQLELINPDLVAEYEDGLAYVEVDDENYLVYDSGVQAGILLALEYLFPTTRTPLYRRKK